MKTVNNSIIVLFVLLISCSNFNVTPESQLESLIYSKKTIAELIKNGDVKIDKRQVINNPNFYDTLLINIRDKFNGGYNIIYELEAYIENENICMKYEVLIITKDSTDDNYYELGFIKDLQNDWCLRNFRVFDKNKLKEYYEELKDENK